MTDTIKGQGSCACGSIKITANSMSKSIGACHCKTCRKWAGGPLITVDCGSDVSFENSENIATFNSSEWAERGYCNQCGSNLYYKLKSNGQYMMLAGLFSDDSPFVFDHQVFIDERPSYYCFANSTEELTGAELFAKFAPPE